MTGDVKTADLINTVGNFLAQRDIPELTGDALKKVCGVRRADLLIFMAGVFPMDVKRRKEPIKTALPKN